MRLNELKGYRQDPVYKIAANSRDIQHFVTTMKNQGFSREFLGSGFFAGVFTKPGTDVVYKVFEYRDRGYRKYLDYMLRNQDNPHVPKIIGRPIKFDLRQKSGGELPDSEKTTFLNKEVPQHKRMSLIIVKLEKLEPVDTTQQFEEFDTVKRILRSLEQNSVGTSFKAKFEKYKKAKPELFNLLQNLNYLNNDDLDLHTDNVMFRGDTIVIIDPFAFTMGPTRGTWI